MATHNKIVELIAAMDANYRPKRIDGETDALATLWQEAFCNVYDDVLETAVRLTFLECMFPPNIAQINKAIKQLQTEIRQAKESVSDRRPVAELGTATITMEEVQAISAAVKEGKGDQRLAGSDISKIAGVARGLFPGISDEMIRANLPEFSILEREAAACGKCHKTRYCPNSGMSYKAVMMPAGYVKLEAQICQKGREHRIA